MSEKASAQNSNEFGGDFQGQQQWLGNVLNTEGHSFINPTFRVQSFNIHCSSTSAKGDTSDNHIYTTENDFLDALSRPHNLCKAARDSIDGRTLCANVSALVTDDARSVPEIIARLDSTVQRAWGKSCALLLRAFAERLKARNNDRREGEEKARLFVSRLWREISDLVPSISATLSGPSRPSGFAVGYACPQDKHTIQAYVEDDPSQSIKSILILGAAFVFGILYRNASITELYKLLHGMQLMAARIRDDKIAAYASVFIAGFAFCLMQQFYNIRSLGEHTVLLEDVYQQDIRIPVAYFNSLSILKAFLKDQYSGTTAAPFIEADFFNIALGRRDGARLQLSKLGCQRQVRPYTRLVMAVLWQLTAQKCPVCKSLLKTGRDNWSSWMSYYAREADEPLVSGDAATRTTNSENIVGKPRNFMQSNTTAKEVQKSLPRRTLLLKHQSTAEQPHIQSQSFRLVGLRNVDIRVPIVDAANNDRHHDDYGVSIVCLLEVETWAVRHMLDEEHAQLPRKKRDFNRYIFGRMSGHNVVIGYLPRGSHSLGTAATVAREMERTFPQATLRLLVGIGAGVPSAMNDVRLGDVVVSMPSEVHGGVVQYDLGKHTTVGFGGKGLLAPPPASWRNCLAEMQSSHRVQGNQISTFLDEMTAKFPTLVTYRRPASESDVLFLPTNRHVWDEVTCQKCDRRQVVQRVSRAEDTPRILYGLIASINQVVKDAERRDEIARPMGALCLEMEAAGLMVDFCCIVIRGIVDYADSHRNDAWLMYGAAVAAGCVKELLTYIDPVVNKSSAI